MHTGRYRVARTARISCRSWQQQAAGHPLTSHLLPPQQPLLRFLVSRFLVPRVLVPHFLVPCLRTFCLLDMRCGTRCRSNVRTFSVVWQSSWLDGRVHG
jgi:hypothetical protein